MDPKAILAKLENERRMQLANQYFGLETSLAASIGYEAEDFDKFLLGIADIRNERIEMAGEAFEKNLCMKRSVWIARFS